MSDVSGSVKTKTVVSHPTKCALNLGKLKIIMAMLLLLRILFQFQHVLIKVRQEQPILNNTIFFKTYMLQEAPVESFYNFKVSISIFLLERYKSYAISAGINLVLMF